MTDEKYKVKLNEFAEAMINSYKKQSILSKIANVVNFDKHEGNFFQIAQRTLLSKNYFEEGSNVINTFLADDYARAVVWGEENFIIEELIRFAKDGKAKFLEKRKFSFLEISNAVGELDNPTDIFIPIDPPEFYNEVYNWVDEGKKARYENYGLYIFVGHHKIKVHWSSRYTPFNEIIILDRKGIRIIQKKFEDMIIPKGLNNIIYSFKQGEPLRLDFAESKDMNKFDFWLRSVIKIDKILDRAVCVIKLTDKK